MEAKIYSLKNVSLTDYEISIIINSLKNLIKSIRFVSSSYEVVGILSIYGVEHAESIIRKLKEVAK